jgi:drug/metabolite transporter (DMT)-like permease
MSLGSKDVRLDRRALGYALLTALTICGYTIVDGVGARVSGDPHAYSAALFVLNGIPLPLYVLLRRGLTGFAPMRPFVVPGFAGGAMSLAAYWIAIWAMTVAPIPLVAALRETSVLFAALIAALVLKEPVSPRRAIAAAVILTGLATIKLG